MPRRRRKHGRKKPVAGGELTANKENEPLAEDKLATTNKHPPEGKFIIQRNSAPKHKPSTPATETEPTPKSDIKSSATSPGKPTVVPTVGHAASPPANATATTETKPATKSARKRNRRSTAKPKTNDFDMVEEWNQYWGKGSLADWQRLCQDLDIHGELKTEDECREAMKGVWINIHDFLQAHPKQSVTLFPTERDLAAYTKASGKLYPRDKIEKDGPLQLLMAHTADDAGQRQRARQLKRAKEKSKPRRYAFVPPPVSYGSRRPVREVDVV